ncbi:MAG TPA: aldehyde dehydrogenase family protein [Bacteroidales bacterium]|nr:aldehyde dehydrogenase family protein [Bacteroidales bacterium]
MELTTAFGIKEAFEKTGLKELNSGACTGTNWLDTEGDIIESFSPNDGKVIGRIKQASKDDYEKVIATAANAFKVWREVPAPKRGEIVRQIGLELREYKEYLGKIVSHEMGKIYQEGLGEVQEMIDICDFAVGQSRMLYGMTTHSEREQHRMYEQYHPLGIVGVISAFNFPVAVYAWNAMLALVAGDVVVWKPSSKVLLNAIAVQNIVGSVLKRNNLPEGILNLVAGSSRNIGDNFLNDKRIPLISATGSTPMGKRVGRIVGERLGRTILELGGNNAIIVTKDADIDMAVRATLFGAVGTTGQRCTSTRRVIIQQDVYDTFTEKLVHAYKQVTGRVGHSLDPETLVGPMIDKTEVEVVLHAIEEVKKEGGKILFGGEKLSGKGYDSDCYMVPAIAEVQNHYNIVQEETFGPLLHLIKYNELDEAIEYHNDVPQGLSSAIFSRNLIETERFLSGTGSDCGIANVNIGTSGAEIGGAFGGEKDTGGGRESGSDAWKSYMRRQTNTINYGTSLPLAQGIKFDI